MRVEAKVVWTSPMLVNYFRSYSPYIDFRLNTFSSHVSKLSSSSTSKTTILFRSESFVVINSINFLLDRITGGRRNRTSNWTGNIYIICQKSEFWYNWFWFRKCKRTKMISSLLTFSVCSIFLQLVHVVHMLRKKKIRNVRVNYYQWVMVLLSIHH
jgi:hypothetical protein